MKKNKNKKHDIQHVWYVQSQHVQMEHPLYRTGTARKQSGHTTESHSKAHSRPLNPLPRKNTLRLKPNNMRIPMHTKIKHIHPLAASSVIPSATTTARMQRQFSHARGRFYVPLGRRPASKFSSQSPLPSPDRPAPPGLHGNTAAGTASR